MWCLEEHHHDSMKKEPNTQLATVRDELDRHVGILSGNRHKPEWFLSSLILDKFNTQKIWASPSYPFSCGNSPKGEECGSNDLSQISSSVNNVTKDIMTHTHNTNKVPESVDWDPFRTKIRNKEEEEEAWRERNENHFHHHHHRRRRRR